MMISALKFYNTEETETAVIDTSHYIYFTLLSIFNNIYLYRDSKITILTNLFQLTQTFVSLDT